MDPNVRVYIAALRDGKDWRDAFVEYCWAKLAVPIDSGMLHEMDDPFLCPPALDLSSASAMASDAFDEGGSDQDIADAFAKGLVVDRERGVLWRVMKDSERPTQGDLVRAMNLDEQMKLAELIGVGNVARMVVSSK